MQCLDKLLDIFNDECFLANVSEVLENELYKF